MTALAENMSDIDGLRTFAFPPDSVSPPAAVVGFPETVAYDATMARGEDRIVFPVYVLVGKVSDRTAAPRLCAYLDGSGATSVKTAIESDKTLGGAADSIRVTDADTSVMTVGGTDYLAATFSVEVVG